MAEGKDFLYLNIYNTLKNRIVSGDYPYQSLLPSERLICDEFGVWRTTTRKALDMLAKEGLVEKRPGIGTQVIYERDPKAKNSSKDFSEGVIGFFATDNTVSDKRKSQPYYSDFIFYLEYACRKRNCHMLYAHISNEEEMLHILQNNNFLFVVFLAHENYTCVELTQQMGIPVALLHETYKNFTSISCDHARGAYLALQHLFEKGHKKIGIITGSVDYMSSKDKLDGCRRACSEYNIPFPSGNLLQHGNWDYDSGYACAKKMLSNVERKNVPTAIFVFNDTMCIGAMRAIRELGYRIPDDISIIGSDNMEQLKCSEPDLTTIDTGIALTAEAVVTCAVNNIAANLDFPIKLLTPVSLVCRSTVRNIKVD